MEWKSSTDKNKYGDVIGEVKHHTLYEDGSITHYDVKFGNKSMSKVNLKSLQKMETSRLKNLLKESHEMLELGKNSSNPGDTSYLEEWIQVAEMELKKRE